MSTRWPDRALLPGVLLGVGVVPDRRHLGSGIAGVTAGLWDRELHAGATCETAAASDRRKEAVMRVLVAAVTAVLALQGAAAAGPPGPIWAGDRWGADDTFSAALRTFAGCDDLLSYFRNEAYPLVTAYGLGYGYGYPGPVPLPVDDGEAGADAPAPPPPPPAPAPAAPPGGVSGTNVQEVGVDEPDLVKTDGRLLVAVTRGALQVVDVSGEVPELRSTTPLDGGYGSELLLDGSTLLVMAPHDVFAEADASLVVSSPRTTLTRYDLSDPAAPQVRDRLVVDGRYVSARMVDGVARVVVTSGPHDLPFAFPHDGTPEAEQDALAHNREVVATSTLDAWLPLLRSDGAAARAVDCADVRAPEAFSGLAVTTVLTVDLDAGVDLAAADAVVADAQIVYASPASLYVATTRWGPWRAGEDTGAEEVTTEIHRFDTGDPAVARYTASGSVPGVVLNQFAFSEHAGTLRVATTEQPPWDRTDAVSQSTVTVLREDADRLVEVGRLGGLGRTEQIFAVRFLGDLAAVVTFRQTDPLYLVDLTDPAAPRLAGELHVPGYSAYLHPVADGRLLGVGQDADAEGRIRGTQVSLFDVSEPAAPTRLDQLVYPEHHSEVEYDHRAFLYWPPAGLAVVPLTGPALLGAAALDVGRATLSEAQRLEHGGHDPVRRALVVGDRLFTLSDARLEAVALGTFADRGAVAFPAGVAEPQPGATPPNG